MFYKALLTPLFKKIYRYPFLPRSAYSTEKLPYLGKLRRLLEFVRVDFNKTLYRATVCMLQLHLSQQLYPN